MGRNFYSKWKWTLWRRDRPLMRSFAHERTKMSLSLNNNVCIYRFPPTSHLAVPEVWTGMSSHMVCLILVLSLVRETKFTPVQSQRFSSYPVSPTSQLVQRICYCRKVLPKDQYLYTNSQLFIPRTEFFHQHHSQNFYYRDISTVIINYWLWSTVVSWLVTTVYKEPAISTLTTMLTLGAAYCSEM